MQIGRRRIEASLDTQWAAQREALLQLALEQNLVGAAAELPQLVVNRLHGRIRAVD